MEPDPNPAPGASLYVYVGNEPLVATDRRGSCVEDGCVVEVTVLTLEGPEIVGGAGAAATALANILVGGAGNMDTCGCMSAQAGPDMANCLADCEKQKAEDENNKNECKKDDGKKKLSPRDSCCFKKAQNAIDACIASGKDLADCVPIGERVMMRCKANPAKYGCPKE